jgi:hypothetical protein
MNRIKLVALLLFIANEIRGLLVVLAILAANHWHLPSVGYFLSLVAHR